MSQRFSCGITTANGAAGAPIIEIIPPPGRSIAVVSIKGAITVATASFYAIARSVNKGTTPSGIAFGESIDAQTPPRKSLTQCATAWAVAPSGVTTVLAHLITAGVLGGGVEWRPSMPVQISGSLMIYNFVASAAGALFTVEWDEDPV